MDRATTDWFEEEAFWEAGFPFMFLEASFDEVREQVGQIIALSGVERGALLDLCCGPGRFAIPLALKGFNVTGVDRTQFLLDHAREYAARESAKVEWVESDMRRFSRPDSFDLAINMYTSFGYFDDPSENSLVLQNVYDNLKQGGVFVVEIMGKEILARVFDATGSTEIEGVGLAVQRRKVIDDWSRMENEWIFIRDGMTKTFRFRHWIYSARELRTMLETAGFDTVSLYGDLAGLPYGPHAKRLVAVARKT